MTAAKYSVAELTKTIRAKENEMIACQTRLHCMRERKQGAGQFCESVYYQWVILKYCVNCQNEKCVVVYQPDLALWAT